jgi:hypothetical protein
VTARVRPLRAGSGSGRALAASCTYKTKTSFSDKSLAGKTRVVHARSWATRCSTPKFAKSRRVRIGNQRRVDVGTTGSPGWLAKLRAGLDDGPATRWE